MIYPRQYLQTLEHKVFMESFEIYSQLILVCPLDYCSIETKATTKYTPEGEGETRCPHHKKKKKKKKKPGDGNLSLYFSKHLQKQRKPCNQLQCPHDPVSKVSKILPILFSLSAPNSVCVGNGLF